MCVCIVGCLGERAKLGKMRDPDRLGRNRHGKTQGRGDKEVWLCKLL